MESQRAERIVQALLVRLSMQAEGTLERLEEDFPDHPEAMRFFHELFRRSFGGSARAEEGRKTIGTTCIQVPEELLHAAGVRSWRLCSGADGFAQLGAELVPAASCALVKGAVGMALTFESVFKTRLDAVIVPGTCEQKRKAGEILQERGLPVRTLEAPHSKESEEAVRYWHRSIRKLLLDLQEITGTTITRRRVLEAVQTFNRAREQYRRLWKLQQSVPPLLYGTDAILAANAYGFCDIDRWTEAATRLNDELERLAAAGAPVGNKRAPRVLLTGSPFLFPDLKVPMLVEASGAVIVADELCGSSRLLYDTVFYEEGNLYDLIPAIADRYLKPCTCPYLTPNPDRTRRLLEAVRRSSADGVVYHAYSGCSLFAMEQRRVADTLLSQSIPMLYLETDASPEDTGQLSTRIEAFVESLNARKKGR